MPTGKELIFTGMPIDMIVKDRIVDRGGAANMLGRCLK